MHPDPQRSVYNGRMLSYAEQSLCDWVSRNGAIPFLIPPRLAEGTDRITSEEVMGELDGLVLQGGVDVSPSSYGETARRPEWSGDRIRDRYELDLITAAIDSNRPVLGVCRGCQLLNVAFGGTLHQDIPTEVAGAVAHRNADLYERNHHTVDFAPASPLARWFGVTRGMINSVHHQAVRDVAEGFEVWARSSEDDVIEAIARPWESDAEPWVVGIQWHPEFQSDEEELLPAAPVLQAFLSAAQRRRDQR